MPRVFEVSVLLGLGWDATNPPDVAIFHGHRYYHVTDTSLRRFRRVVALRKPDDGDFDTKVHQMRISHVYNFPDRAKRIEPADMSLLVLERAHLTGEITDADYANAVHARRNALRAPVLPAISDIAHPPDDDYDSWLEENAKLDDNWLEGEYHEDTDADVVEAWAVWQLSSGDDRKSWDAFRKHRVEGGDARPPWDGKVPF